MHVTLLCNAGMAITHENRTLLLDAPNRAVSPFYAIPEETKMAVLNREAPFDNVCGLCFTHDHEDHCDQQFLREFHRQYPDIPICSPSPKTQQGSMKIGPFTIAYQNIPHAPMDVPTPPHTVCLISSGEKSIYIAGDAELNCDRHLTFLAGRKVDAAFWNSMYLSRPETRLLLRETTQRNFIYHMPANRDDGFGLWKKCLNNLKRFESELLSVTVLDHYPTDITI